MIKQSSWFFVMTLYQIFLSNSLHVSRHDFLSIDLHVFSSWFFINRSSCSSSWLSDFIKIKCKKIMQKNNAKSGKISIFSSLDVKLEFWINRVELTQFSVESNRVKLKICSTQLDSSWKCEQFDFKSSWIQNVNSKLDLIISLSISLIRIFSASWKQKLLNIVVDSCSKCILMSERATDSIISILHFLWRISYNESQFICIKFEEI